MSFRKPLPSHLEHILPRHPYPHVCASNVSARLTAPAARLPADLCFLPSQSWTPILWNHEPEINTFFLMPWSWCFCHDDRKVTKTDTLHGKVIDCPLAGERTVCLCVWHVGYCFLYVLMSCTLYELRFTRDLLRRLFLRGGCCPLPGGPVEPSWLLQKGMTDEDAVTHGSGHELQNRANRLRRKT